MTIEIWNPRWHDRKVLIAKYKVKPGKNTIVFTKAKSLPGKYYLTGNEIASYPTETNGTIDCYCVPLDAFVNELDLKAQEEHKLL